MNAILLSVCIPVYNFGSFIGETLASIIPQATGEVEIVVVDGASTDNTAEVVQSYQQTFHRLRYHRLEKRGGIDRDMAKSVEIATGEYCWLFGGDDIMNRGAIKKVLDEINHKHDVYLSESILCRKEMTPIAKHRMLNLTTERTFDLRYNKDRKEYFRRARNSAAFFSFCSAIIFRKSRWECVCVDDTFYGTCWAHAARIFGMQQNGLTVKYLPDPLLKKRGENDSFMDKGIVHRCGIAINGYTKIADTYFGHDSSEAFHIRRALRNEWPLGAFFRMRITVESAGQHEQRMILDRLALKLYSDRVFTSRVNLLAYRYTPFFILKMIKLTIDLWRSFLTKRK